MDLDALCAPLQQPHRSQGTKRKYCFLTPSPTSDEPLLDARSAPPDESSSDSDVRLATVYFHAASLEPASGIQPDTREDNGIAANESRFSKAEHSDVPARKRRSTAPSAWPDTSSEGHHPNVGAQVRGLGISGVSFPSSMTRMVQAPDLSTPEPPSPVLTLSPVSSVGVHVHQFVRDAYICILSELSQEYQRAERNGIRYSMASSAPINIVCASRSLRPLLLLQQALRVLMPVFDGIYAFRSAPYPPFAQRTIKQGRQPAFQDTMRSSLLLTLRSRPTGRTPTIPDCLQWHKHLLVYPHLPLVETFSHFRRPSGPIVSPRLL